MARVPIAPSQPGGRVVVLISHTAPPQANAGAGRLAGFVRHLPDFDWRPVVVSSAFAGDGSVAGATTLRPGEPLVPFQRRFGGSDTMTAGSEDDTLLKRVLLACLAVPDVHLGWVPAATVATVRAARRERASALFSTSPSESSHLVALLAARATGLPWVVETAGLPPLNLNAAGIDVGSAEPYVAVPPDRSPEPVRRFASFTADLHALADWLQACHIDTVVMESTGVYWIPCSKSWKRGALRFTWSTPVMRNTCPGAKPTSPTASGCKNFTPSGCSTAHSGPPMRSACYGHTYVSATPSSPPRLPASSTGKRPSPT